MARTIVVVLMGAVLCLSGLCLTGCSLTYKKRATKDADIGQSTVFEYGFFGLPDTDSETPGGLLPLFRSEKPLSQD